MEDNSNIGNSIAKLFKVVQNRLKFSAKIFREIHVHYNTSGWGTLWITRGGKETALFYLKVKLLFLSVLQDKWTILFFKYNVRDKAVFGYVLKIFYYEVFYEISPCLTPLPRSSFHKTVPSFDVISPALRFRRNRIPHNGPRCLDHTDIVS